MPKLSEIMSEDVVTVTPETSLREAIEVLRAEGITGVPVVSGETVVGVLSVNDVLEFEAVTPAVPVERTAQVEWGGLEEEDESLRAEAGEIPPRRPAADRAAPGCRFSRRAAWRGRRWRWRPCRRQRARSTGLPRGASR